MKGYAYCLSWLFAGVRTLCGVVVMVTEIHFPFPDSLCHFDL